MRILIRMRSFFGVIALTIAFAGCSASGSIVNLSGSPENAREKNGDFIELKDGNIINGSIDKMILTYSLNRGVKMDGQQYKYEDIHAVQKNNHYFRRFNKKIFVERIVNGNISVYRQTQSFDRTYNNTNYSRTYDYYLYYLQKCAKEKIEYWDLKTLKAMVADNPAAAAAYSDYKNLGAKEKNKHGASDLDNVISIYNN